ncbi:MAG: hypothetical protein JWM35_1747 [Verrucomicrobia bacterium]|nr:hypothetical protein [Verrucomicrobiota bacterium]
MKEGLVAAVQETGPETEAHFLHDAGLGYWSATPGQEIVRFDD